VAALHNRLLLLADRQPTTLHVGDGIMCGFTIPAMTRFRIATSVSDSPGSPGSVSLRLLTL
jgi:hypothetical protein